MTVKYLIALVLRGVSNSKFFIFVIFFGTLSCDFSKQGAIQPSTLVDVYVEQVSKIFLEGADKQICHRGRPDKDFYGLTLKEEEEDDNTNNQQQGTENQNTQQQQTDTSAKRSTLDVEENWFKAGLVITNKSTEHWLIVNSVEFDISAKWGKDTLKSTKPFNKNYCGSEYLYIVPPTPEKDAQKNQFSGNFYAPDKQNNPNNLTLYITGVPIPEKAAETLQQEDSKSDTKSNTPTNQPEKKFILTQLPSYRVTVTLRGSWVDKEENPVDNFNTQFQFTIDSQRISR